MWNSFCYEIVPWVQCRRVSKLESRHTICWTESAATAGTDCMIKAGYSMITPCSVHTDVWKFRSSVLNTVCLRAGNRSSNLLSQLTTRTKLIVFHFRSSWASSSLHNGWARQRRLHLGPETFHYTWGVFKGVETKLGSFALTPLAWRKFGRFPVFPSLRKVEQDGRRLFCSAASSWYKVERRVPFPEDDYDVYWQIAAAASTSVLQSIEDCLSSMSQKAQRKVAVEAMHSNSSVVYWASFSRLQ